MAWDGRAGPAPAQDPVAAALARLDAWIESEGFVGWDPFDALNSPLLRRLAGDSRRRGQVVVQLLKRSPVNLRPLLGVPKSFNPKAMGLFLASYWRKYCTGGSDADLEHARFFADWLQRNASPGFSGACWGYDFDWPNRAFYARAGTPTVVNTAFVAAAFLDLQQIPACELVQGASTNPIGKAEWNDVPLRVARSACDFVLGDLNVHRAAGDEICFSYTPGDHRLVHNANVLGARLLAEVGAITGEATLTENALAAARFTARRQRPDGSWRYGEAANDGWVDSFHTGYVLTALERIGELTQSADLNAAAARGYELWKGSMFLPDMTPKYYAGSTYPIDIHCVAQAILTFLAFADRDGDAAAAAVRTARWAIDNMQDERGYFHYRIHRTHRCRIPYMRWGQAWMQRALTELVMAGDGS